MRFFTPELYVQANSADDAEADRAEEAWEVAIGDYRRHLASIRKKLPPSAIQLAKLYLHDWEFLAFDKHNPATIEIIPLRKKFASAWLSLRSGDQVTELLYILCGDVQEHVGKFGRKLAAGTKIWLYEEVDLHGDNPNAFVHRILWSDGRITEIPSYSVVIHTFSIPQNGSKRKTRGIAS